MRKGLPILIVLIIQIALSIPLQGQRMTTMGNDFWVCFLKTHNNNNNPNYTSRKIFVSGANSCDVTVSNPMTGWSQTSHVTANTITTISVPTNDSWNETSETVMDKGFHITSTDDVSVYLSTTGVNSYDVTNAFPTAAMRDEYMVLSYPSDRWGSVFAVLATEDSTWVDVCLTSSTLQGASGGDTLTFLLPHAGQMYQVITPATGDFTGSYVKSRDCKPIALFHGDVCLYVPDWESGVTCDHVFEQAAPTAYWGRKFVVPHFSPTHTDYVRVTSLRDSCKVFRNGLYAATLNAGESYNFQSPTSETPNVVTSSLPVSVNVYFASVGFEGMGDPSMLTIVPIEQMVHNVTFASFNTPYTTNHKINIVLKTVDIMHFRLDGVQYANVFHPVPADRTYSYATITVLQGSHTMTMSGAGEGFVAFAYGMGSHESYGYSVGSQLQSLVNTVFVNNELAEMGDTIDGCVAEMLEMTARHEGAVDSVVWNIGGMRYLGDTVGMVFQDPGLFDVSVNLYHSDVACFEEDNTLLFSLKIGVPDTTEIDTVVCINPFVWFGDSITAEGRYTHVLKNRHGCDSILLMDVVFSSVITAEFDTSVCVNPFVLYGDSITDAGQYEHFIDMADGCDSMLRMTIDFWSIPPTELSVEGCDSVECGGLIFKQDTMLTDTVITADGCDSITNFFLTVYPSYDVVDHCDLEEGDTMYWIDGGIYWSDDQNPYCLLRTVHGCDSIVRLCLNMIPHVEPLVPDSTAIWIPNAFTPDVETNTAFKIESYHIIEMHVYIYDRQGMFVAEFDGLTGNWDGTSRGKRCKQDTYVYLVEFRSKTMPQMVQKRIGTVMLMR